jgi:hypothetical protein
MAIDIKNLVQLIQKKEHAVTSSTSVQDMIDILKAAQKAEGSLIRNYDSAGDLPDAATTNERIAYLSDTRTLRFNNGTWDNPLLGAAGGGVSSTQAQGSVSGYVTGGWPGTLNNIEKFSFTSDGNGTDVGDMTVARNIACGQSSADNGYTSGGNPSPPVGNVIDKFPFAVDANATDVGNLTQQRYGSGGQSSTTHGYTSGGYATVPVSSASNVIDKFPFSADANATDVGDLTVSRTRNAGQSSADNGYTSGGQATPSYYNIIDKFPFATDANATDVGDLVRTDWAGYGQNSSTDGYFSGGILSNTTTESADIQKFPFASDANATDVGDLTLGRYHGQGQSSTASGYSTGGQTTPPQAASNIIDKFPFASDGNATDVGDLTSARGFIAGGQQV